MHNSRNKRAVELLKSLIFGYRVPTSSLINSLLKHKAGSKLESVFKPLVLSPSLPQRGATQLQIGD
jgi:hypothetical protein